MDERKSIDDLYVELDEIDEEIRERERRREEIHRELTDRGEAVPVDDHDPEPFDRFVNRQLNVAVRNAKIVLSGLNEILGRMNGFAIGPGDWAELPVHSMNARDNVQQVFDAQAEAYFNLKRWQERMS